MPPIDIAAAEIAADEEWDRLMALTSAEQRREALNRALGAFEQSLAEQGVWPGDAFARLEILGVAIEELGAHLERQLAPALN